jgi:formate hydrogenlyase transcriptional activator
VDTCARRLRKRIDTIPADVLDALTHYHWPGNVRELQNVIERAVILTPVDDFRHLLSLIDPHSAPPLPPCSRNPLIK